MPKPENIVLTVLREMRAEMGVMRAEMATKADVVPLDAKIDDVCSEGHSLRADVGSDMLAQEKRLGDQIVTLRRAVMERHSTAIGHGVLYSGIDERVRPIERHLNLGAQ